MTAEREALEWAHDITDDKQIPDESTCGVTVGYLRILLALAERAAGEPVAWVHPCGEFVLVDPEDEDTHDFSNTGDGKWRALVYAAPDAGENPSKK